MEKRGEDAKVGSSEGGNEIEKVGFIHVYLKFVNFCGKLVLNLNNLFLKEVLSVNVFLQSVVLGC